MPDVHDPPRLEAIAIDVARTAAAMVRDAAGPVVRHGTKSSPSDVVTETDLAVEKSITEALLAATPSASVLGEEHPPTAGGGSLRWIVDPIDGTVNMTRGLPVMSVSIAAEVAGCVTAGAIADIGAGDVYSAALGGGARRDDRPIRASTASELSTALLATGFDYAADRRCAEAAVFARVLPAVADIRCFGSAALHLAWVASGRVDAYYQWNLKPWDRAAGALIAREAGATVVETGGSDGAGFILAASGGLSDQLRRLLDA